MFRIVLRFKSQNVMLFYTWPFNPRPPLFKGGLCLPLLKIPKRCRPETILLRYCANHRRIRASSKIEKCAESGARCRRNRAPSSKREFPAPVFASLIKIACAVIGGIIGESGICPSPHVRRKNCGAARREKLRTIMQTAHPHRKHADTAFKLRRQNAPQDDLNNARTGPP